ncbi:MAG: 3-methyladenine DNA glycosylase [Verrucomicrobiota bacterium]
MARRDEHIQICEQLVDPLTRNARNGEPHPVYDFLFEYYRFRPQLLKRWSPGFGVFLEGATVAEVPALTRWEEAGGYVEVTSFPQKRQEGLDWVISLLEAIAARPALHACSGLHEWAMVYQSEQPRHAVPLRFSSDTIRDIVERQPLVCTHYDAFRFFTHAATPRNRVQLTKENRISHDQPGCIHANMDLYKWAYKFYPWIRSERILEAFRLALKARELDMRASPYDLKEWGFAPVKIETDAGRQEYDQAQRELAQAAVPIRQALLQELKSLRKALTHS